MMTFIILSLGVLLISSTTPDQINQVITKLKMEE